MDYSQIKETILKKGYIQISQKDINITNVLVVFKKQNTLLNVKFQIGGNIISLSIDSVSYNFEDFIQKI